MTASPRFPQEGPSFDEFIKKHPEAIKELRRIAQDCTSAKYFDERANQLFDHLCDQLRRQWTSITVSWKALARKIARRWASRHGPDCDGIQIGGVDPQMLEPPRTKAKTPTPDRIVIDDEERRRLLAALKKLSKEERRITDAFTNSASAREAARRLAVPETSFRVELHQIVSKLAAAIAESGSAV